MTEIKEGVPQCWAHNLTGDRCHQPGGHEGDHSMTVSWDDSECWDMAGTIMVPVLDVPYRTDEPRYPSAAVMTLAAGEEQPVGSVRICIVCEHLWHETDGCDGKGPAGMSCDCRTPV